MRSVADCDVQFDQPMVVWIDGVRYGTAQHLQVIVEPDAYAIYV
jgi:hypothetical protein